MRLFFLFPLLSKIIKNAEKRTKTQEKLHHFSITIFATVAETAWEEESLPELQIAGRRTEKQEDFS